VVHLIDAERATSSFNVPPATWHSFQRAPKMAAIQPFAVLLLMLFSRGIPPICFRAAPLFFLRTELFPHCLLAKLLFFSRRKK
jgi:hypothetical protein